MSADDRIRCQDCRLLTRTGQCGAAQARTRIDVGQHYAPCVAFPLRCAFYLPQPDDPDQRGGRERWPALWADYVEFCEARA
jgi:hypothetical protein